MCAVPALAGLEVCGTDDQSLAASRPSTELAFGALGSSGITYTEDIMRRDIWKVVVGSSEREPRENMKTQ